MAHRLVKLFVLGCFNILTRAGPKCFRFINSLVLYDFLFFYLSFTIIIGFRASHLFFRHEDWNGNMISIFFYYTTQAVTLCVLFFLGFEVQGNFCTRGWLSCSLE